MCSYKMKLFTVISQRDVPHVFLKWHCKLSTHWNGMPIENWSKVKKYKNIRGNLNIEYIFYIKRDHLFPLYNDVLFYIWQIKAIAVHKWNETLLANFIWFYAKIHQWAHRTVVDIDFILYCVIFLGHIHFLRFCLCKSQVTLKFFIINMF